MPEFHRIAARADHLDSRRGLRLLDERQEGLHPMLRRRLHLDIAVARFGTVGSDAERREATSPRFLHADRHRTIEGRLIGDRVVRGQHQQHSVRIDLDRKPGRQTDCRSSVAARRLHDDTTRPHARLPHLVGRDETKVAMRHQQGIGETGLADAAERALE